MEELLKNLSREILRGSNISGEWEDGSDYLEYYAVIKDILDDLGIDLTKSEKVLELGSGNAKLTNYLKKQGINIVGVDASARGIKQSPQITARIEQLPFPDETFDFILSSGNVFDTHVYDQNHNLMMKEIARVLKHGGIYFGLQEEISAEPVDGLNLIPHSYLKSFYKKS